MATIQERKQKDGIVSFKLQIRRKNVEIHKTFHTKEDAEIYAFYKERLIDNIENFDIPIEERITLKQIFEIKLKDSQNLAKRSILDMENAFNLLNKFLDVSRFIHEINYQDWEISAQEMFKTDVYMGAKTEAGKRKMSPLTLRRNFACYSSAYSNAIAKGFNIENMPLKIMQNFINPLINELKK
jgi:hypothetical protein